MEINFFYKKSIASIIIVAMFLSNVPIISVNADEDEITPLECFEFDIETNTIINYRETYLENNCPKNIIIPNQINGVSVENIGHEAFRQKELNSVIIPEGIKEIGNGAFIYNENLGEIILPNTIEKIGELAFRGNGLSHIILPEGLKEIGNGAFSWNQIQDLVIPSTVNKIGRLSFNDNNLNSIEFKSNNELKIGVNAFEYYNDGIKISGLGITPNNQITCEEGGFEWNENQCETFIYNESSCISLNSPWLGLWEENNCDVFYTGVFQGNWIIDNNTWVKNIEKIILPTQDISYKKGTNTSTDLTEKVIASNEEFTLKLAEINAEGNKSDLEGERKSDHLIFMPSLENIQGKLVIENMTIKTEGLANDILVFSGSTSVNDLINSINSIEVVDGQNGYKTFILDLENIGTIELVNIINGSALSVYGINSNVILTIEQKNSIINLLFGTTFINWDIFINLLIDINSFNESNISDITRTSAKYNSKYILSLYSDSERTNTVGTVVDGNITNLQENNTYYYTLSFLNTLQNIKKDGSFTTLSTIKENQDISSLKGTNLITNLTTKEITLNEEFTLKLGEIVDGNKTQLAGDRDSDHIILMPNFEQIQGKIIIENMTIEKEGLVNDILVFDGGDIDVLFKLLLIPNIEVIDGDGDYKTFVLDLINNGKIELKNIIDLDTLNSYGVFQNGNLTSEQKDNIINTLYGNTFISTDTYLSLLLENHDLFSYLFPDIVTSPNLTIKGDINNKKLFLNLENITLIIENDEGNVTLSGSINVDGDWDGIFLSPRSVDNLENTPANTLLTIKVGGNDGFTINPADGEKFKVSYKVNNGVIGKTYRVLKSNGVNEFVEIDNCVLDSVKNCKFETDSFSYFALIDISVDGICGTNNGKSFTSTPNTNLCSSGNASSVILTGNNYSWSCSGVNGGDNSSCSGNRTVSSGGGGGGSVWTSNSIITNETKITTISNENEYISIINENTGNEKNNKNIKTNTILTNENIFSMFSKIEKNNININGVNYIILKPDFGEEKNKIVDKITDLVFKRIDNRSISKKDSEIFVNEYSTFLVGLRLQMEGDERGKKITKNSLNKINNLIRKYNIINNTQIKLL